MFSLTFAYLALQWAFLFSWPIKYCFNEDKPFNSVYQVFIGHHWMPGTDVENLCMNKTRPWFPWDYLHDNGENDCKYYAKY